MKRGERKEKEKKVRRGRGFIIQGTDYITSFNIVTSQLHLVVLKIRLEPKPPPKNFNRFRWNYHIVSTIAELEFDNPYHLCLSQFPDGPQYYSRGAYTWPVPRRTRQMRFTAKCMYCTPPETGLVTKVSRLGTLSAQWVVSTEIALFIAKGNT